MKRLISFMICLILFSTAICGFAETATEDKTIDTTFDNTKFEKYSGYTYRKMDKTYRYEASYTHEYSDGEFEWLLVAEGEKGNTGSLWMAVDLYQSGKGYRKIDTMYILIDDVTYTFKSMNISDSGNYSTATFGNIGIDMVQALSKAKDVAIRIEYEGYYMDEEPTITKLNDVIKWAKNIVNSGYITKMDTTYFDAFDWYYKASKE